jgi:succinate dehydrogenase/fumarate reductase cytochrome b subunit
MKNSSYSLNNAAHYAGDKSKDWIEKLARFGFAAKGAIYVLIGILALMAALNMGSSSQASRNGAMQLIFEQPFGKILGWLVVIGLIGYVIWRLFQAVMNPDHKKNDAKGMLSRVRYAFSGLLYGAFTYSMIKALTGNGSSGGGGNSRQSMAAQVMQWDGGSTIIAIVGIITMIAGFVNLYRAYTTKFKEKLNNNRMSYNEEKWITRLGRAGFSARGVVWLILGFFIVKAGLSSDASQVKSSQGAFSFLEQSGEWVLLLVAIGVIAYGVFQFAKAKYYQINI